MPIYKKYAELLLDAITTQQPEQLIYKSKINNGDFGIRWKSNYSGLMAKNPKNHRIKQGYFDFIIKHGNDQAKLDTHKDLFIKLLKCSSIEKARRVWRGEDPLLVGSSEVEKEVLLVFTLMMFEQEVNWGNQTWQKWTNFPPTSKSPNYRRPRDMLMGFVEQLFEIDNIEKLKYWDPNKPGTVHFGDSYEKYDNKEYFEKLENDEIASALIVGKQWGKFKDLVDIAPDNPKHPGN